MRMRDDDGHHAMQEAGKAWKRVKGHQTKLWSDWTMVIGPALMKARAEAMATAETPTNRPIGRGYNTAMAGLLEEYGLADMNETARAHILKIMENLAAVEEWRAKQDDPEDLNHPSRVWLKFQRSSTQADERTQKERERCRAERRESASQELESAMERIRELEAEIEHLKVYIQELEAAIERMRKSQPQEQPKRRGRPPGSKNKTVASGAPLDPDKMRKAGFRPTKRRGRPPGSKNRPKPEMQAAG
jgi:predicted transcriptional regulator